MKTIFTNWSLFLPFLDLFISLCGIGMLESMLEPHLKQTGASTSDVGISFLIYGGCYMLGMILAGLVDKICRPIWCSLFGNILFLVTFVLIGPLPILAMEPFKTLIQEMMSLAGFAYSFMMVSSFSRAQNYVICIGFADDIQTYVLISGVWASAFSLGNFVGPTIAGILVEMKGFQVTTYYFCILYAIMIMLDIIDTIHLHKRNQYQEIQK